MLRKTQWQEGFFKTRKNRTKKAHELKFILQVSLLSLTGSSSSLRTCRHVWFYGCCQVLEGSFCTFKWARAYTGEVPQILLYSTSIMVSWHCGGLGSGTQSQNSSSWSPPWCPTGRGYDGSKCPWRWLTSVMKWNLIQEGSLCLLLDIHLPQMYLAFFWISARAMFLLVVTSRSSSLPAHSTTCFWERRWDGGVEQREAQHHFHFPVLCVQVTPYHKSKKSGGNPLRSRVSPGSCALFFCLQSFYQVICSRKDLLSGFGKPGVENLEISTWGEALDSIWGWAGHGHFDLCVSPFKQQDLYLLFLIALLKSSSKVTMPWPATWVWMAMPPCHRQALHSDNAFG